VKFHTQYSLIKGIHPVSQYIICPITSTWEELIPKTNINKMTSIILAKAV